MSSSLSPLETFIYGGISGALTIGITQPFFTYQTYEMAKQPLPSIWSIIKNTGRLAVTFAMKPLEQRVSVLLSSNPHLGVLYRGTFPNLLCEVITQAVAFSVFESSQSMGKLNSSILAGIASAPFVCSLERIMQIQQLEGISASKSVQLIWNREGAQYLFKGLVATLAREAPFTASVFYLSPMIAAFLKSYFPLSDETHLATAQMLAGGICGAITSPAARVKMDMQKDLTRVKMVQVIKQILKQEGFKGFFVGSKERATMICAYTVIMGQTLEGVPKFFSRQIPLV